MPDAGNHRDGTLINGLYQLRIRVAGQGFWRTAATDDGNDLTGLCCIQTIQRGYDLLDIRHLDKLFMEMLRIPYGRRQLADEIVGSLDGIVFGSACDQADIFDIVDGECLLFLRRAVVGRTYLFIFFLLFLTRAYTQYFKRTCKQLHVGTIRIKTNGARYFYPHIVQGVERELFFQCAEWQVQLYRSIRVMMIKHGEQK